MLDYIIIGLLVVLITLLIYTVVQMKKGQKPENHTTEDYQVMENELKLYFQKEYGELKFEMSKLFGEANKTSATDLNLFKDNILLFIDQKFKDINTRVDQKLGEGFNQTNVTFRDVVERLAKIDEAQKKIDALSTEVISLNDLLTDKKTRGIYGEVQLYALLSAIMGDNKALYEKQKTMPNGFIADAIIYAPEPIGMVAVDSKFPLDNYKRMVNKEFGDADRRQAEKDFKNDVKKHITDIKTKYIIENVTGDQAFMFVPAEAIFAEITAHHEDLVDFSQKNKVYIVSPTTLISTLSLIQMVVKNLERDKQAAVIVDELRKLGDEFRRYTDRWDKLKKSIESVSKNAEAVAVTSSKISNKFQHISEAKFDMIESEDMDEIESSEDQD
jgi:DNA recombination protein RmuC